MDVSREHQTGNQTRGPKRRTGTSKYDFFKVKVWLGENMDHYYILSRFLICRMLTVTKIPYIKAVKIALETKKYLVDSNLTDITQTQLEEVLFSIIRSKGFDEQYIDCYRMVTQFYQSRQPLCIIICGTAWTGKSTIAQQLASRINIPNVMQTDVIYELLRHDKDSPLGHHPLWCRPGLVDAGLVSEFRREARVVHKGMEGDLNKTLSDGKPIIIEGMHLDPGLYIPDFGQRGIIMLPAKPTAVHLTRAARPAAGSSAPRPTYQRSMTSASFTRVEASPSRPAASASRYADRKFAGVGTAEGAGGIDLHFSRCVSADAELAMPEYSTAAADDAVVGPRPRSAGRSDKPHCYQAALDLSDAAVNGSAGKGTPVHAAGPESASCKITGAQRSQGDSSQRQQQRFRVSLHLDTDQQDRIVAIKHRGSALECSQMSSTADPDLVDRVFVDADQHDAADAVHPEGAATRDCFQQPGAGSDSLGSEGSQNRLHITKSSTDDVTSTAILGNCEHRQVAGWSRSCVLQMSTGDEAVAAPAPASSYPYHSSMSPSASPTGKMSSPPPVIMLEHLHVCAATAEAVALQQQALQQQHHAQRGSPPAHPGSPCSDGETAVGVSPCISQEHSTTEVVSRQPSASLPSPGILSQEPSASDKILLCPDATGEEVPAGNCVAQGEIVCSSGADGDGSRMQDSLVSLGRFNAENAAQDGASHTVPSELGLGTIEQQDHMHHAKEDALGAICSAAYPEDSSVQESAAIDEAVGRNQLVQRLQTAARESASADGKQQPSLCEQSCATQQQHSPFGERSQVPLPAAALASEAADGAADNGSMRAKCNTDKKDTIGGNDQLDHKPQVKEHVHKPLFVPMLVYMDEADHALMQEEALNHVAESWPWQPSTDDAAGSQVAQVPDAIDATAAATEPDTAAGASVESEQQVGCSQPDAREALRRTRLLQEYLCAYEAQGLPVIKVSYGNFSEALDKLHEYILQCIKVAMQL